MQAMNVTIIPNEFITEYMKRLPMACSLIYVVLCSHSCGHIESVEAMTTKDILGYLKISRKTMTDAMKTLEAEGLIKIYEGGGRGKQNGYVVCMEKQTRQNIPSNKNLVNFGTIHGFSNDLFLASPPCPEEKTATPSPTAKVLKPSKPKRSDEEWTVFHDLWAVFEKSIGCKIAGKDAAMEAKSIWELIDRKRDGNGGLVELKEIVCKFIEMRKNPPDGLEYLGKLLPLPHILNSTRTWLNVTTKEITADRTPTKEETAEYVKGIREKCGKK